jgi:hypothetical protein
LRTVSNPYPARAGKIIFFLGAQPGDKKFLQTNGVFSFAKSACA